MGYFPNPCLYLFTYILVTSGLRLFNVFDGWEALKWVIWFSSNRHSDLFLCLLFKDGLGSPPKVLGYYYYKLLSLKSSRLQESNKSNWNNYEFKDIMLLEFKDLKFGNSFAWKKLTWSSKMWMLWFILVF